MKKRILTITFTVIFVFVSCFTLCFASDATFFSDLDYSSYPVSDGSLDEISANSDGNIVAYFISYPVDDLIITLTFNYIGSDSTLYFNNSAFNVYSDSLGEFITSLDVAYGDEVELILYPLNLVIDDYITISSFTPFSSGDNFDFSSLIGIVGSFVSFVVNSPVLLALLLIGVTCSVGFVAVKVIRKVMWGN